MSEAAPRGSAVIEEDFAITCAGVPIPLFNTGFVFGSVRLPRLRSVVARTRDYFASQGVTGCFVIPEPLEPKGAHEIFAEFGMHTALRTTGMRTTALASPKHQLAPCDIRELSGDDAARVLAEVNTTAYGMDSRAVEVMTLPLLWRPPVRSYAVFERRRAVAVGAVAMLEYIAYVMWMATLPEARRRGYAEVIIRRALADCGAAATVLHATAAGLPVYKRLGYQTIAEFPGYVFPAK